METIDAVNSVIKIPYRTSTEGVEAKSYFLVPKDVYDTWEWANTNELTHLAERWLLCSDNMAERKIK